MTKLTVDLGDTRGGQGNRYFSLVRYELQAAIDLLDDAMSRFEENSVEIDDAVTIDLSLPELLTDMECILDENWNRPVQLQCTGGDDNVAAIMALLNAKAAADLDFTMRRPVEYNMGGQRYDDLSIQTILEDGISEVNFKEHFARANALCATNAMTNIQNAKEKLNEILRIAR